VLIPVNDTCGAHFPPGTAERVVPALQTRRVGMLLRAVLPRLAKSTGVLHDVPLSSESLGIGPGVVSG